MWVCGIIDVFFLILQIVLKKRIGTVNNSDGEKAVWRWRVKKEMPVDGSAFHEQMIVRWLVYYMWALSLEAIKPEGWWSNDEY